MMDTHSGMLTTWPFHFSRKTQRLDQRGIDWSHMMCMLTIIPWLAGTFAYRGPAADINLMMDVPMP